MKLIDVWNWLVQDSSAVVLAQFDRQITFLNAVIESTDFALVASELVAADSFELVRMVKPLNSSMALCAFKTSRALVPRNRLGKCLTVFRRILEHFWRPSEIP